VAAHTSVQNMASTSITKTVLKHEDLFFKAGYYLLDERQRPSGSFGNVGLLQEGKRLKIVDIRIDIDCHICFF